MEQAIKKAIKGGWKPLGEAVHKNFLDKKWGISEINANYYHQPTWLLQPSFWQCLGKAMGWKEYLEAGGLTTDEEYCMDLGWRVVWHSFIDHLSHGKDAESFFNELLK